MAAYLGMCILLTWSETRFVCECCVSTLNESYIYPAKSNKLIPCELASRMNLKLQVINTWVMIQTKGNLGIGF